MRRAPTILAVAVLVSLPSGCSATTQPAAQTTTSPAASTLTVFAAASLKGTFTDLGKQFESKNPGTTVSFSFAGSSDLVSQLQQGAPADVFASADTRNMDKAVAANPVAGNPVNFASNTLEIAVAPGNPARIAAFRDLTKPGLTVVVCAPQVPCGAATQTVQKATGITLSPVSQESAVTDVLGKVQTGQADAGLVYVTDVKAAAGRVDGVSFPEAKQAVNVYPIAALAASRNAALAQRFVALVTSADGQKVLRDAGFASP